MSKYSFLRRTLSCVSQKRRFIYTDVFR